uniref:Actin-associated protein FAM107A n=1 Tax=Myotis myotis TaxID=51298 RepID=A0A7J7UC27_MYOMY|nr:family with sequence similarity 107 member A [Myotis myotis]
MYSEIQRERADIGGLMARPEYREWNPELIKPKKLLNPVKASRSHQELHRELLMNHRRGLGVDSKPELQRVLEHRRRNQIIKKKKEELAGGAPAPAALPRPPHPPPAFCTWQP